MERDRIMKKLLTRVMGIALAVSLFIGSGNVFAAEDALKPADMSSQSSAQAISYEETVTVDLSNGVAGKWYKFTGYYRITSSNNNNIDPAGKLYSGLVCLDQDDYSAPNDHSSNFAIIRRLNAGRTYYIWATGKEYHSGTSTYDLTVTWGWNINESD